MSKNTGYARVARFPKALMRGRVHASKYVLYNLPHCIVQYLNLRQLTTKTRFSLEVQQGHPAAMKLSFEDSMTNEKNEVFWWGDIDGDLPGKSDFEWIDPSWLVKFRPVERASNQWPPRWKTNNTGWAPFSHQSLDRVRIVPQHNQSDTPLRFDPRDNDTSQSESRYRNPAFMRSLL